TFTATTAFQRFGASFPIRSTYSSVGTFPVAFPGSYPFTPTIPVVENKTETAAALSQAARTFGPGGALTFAQADSHANLFFPGGTSPPEPSLYTITTAYDYVIPAVPGTPGMFVDQPPLVLVVPSPGGGGAVGRTKIADDNSPLPRDRVLFNYDYFN